MGGWLGRVLALAFLAVLAVGIPAVLSQATQAASAESRPALQPASPAATAMPPAAVPPAAVAPTGMPTTPLIELPPTSAFEGQAKLFAKLRRFYGGTGLWRHRSFAGAGITMSALVRELEGSPASLIAIQP